MLMQPHLDVADPFPRVLLVRCDRLTLGPCLFDERTQLWQGGYRLVVNFINNVSRKQVTTRPVVVIARRATRMPLGRRGDPGRNQGVVRVNRQRQN